MLKRTTKLLKTIVKNVNIKNNSNCVINTFEFLETYGVLLFGFFHIFYLIF